MPTLKPVREVFVDQSGFLLHPWMAVLCQADTGIRYSHRTSGVRCLSRSMDGYYVPVFNRETLACLRSLFEEEREGQGARQGPEVLTPYRERIRDAVSQVRMDSSVGGPGEVPLQLDYSRFGEADEAWIPVVTPNGPGVLIWENSD